MRELPPGLTIRHTTEADLADVARLWADPEVMRWVGYPGGLRLTDDELRRWLAWAEESPDRRHFVVSDDEIGFCGELFSAVDRGTGRAALDVKLLPAARGRGVATAALRWLVDLGPRPGPATSLRARPSGHEPAPIPSPTRGRSAARGEAGTRRPRAARELKVGTLDVWAWT